jgi:glycosyltransferase involved in cell wall biosynthesis
MIPTYNVDDYLERTLESVLAQYSGPDEMEVQIVDGSSSPQKIIDCFARVGKGIVGFRSVPPETRVPAVFTECVRMARGQVVHTLHSDDYVLPGFYEKLKAGFETSASVGLAFCRHRFIDEKSTSLFETELHSQAAGVLPGFINQLAVRNMIHTPSVTVRRKVYEDLGGFDERLCHAADWEMWMRILASHEVWFEPTTLACYRVHQSAGTSMLMRTGSNIIDCRKAMEIFADYLARDGALSVLTAARVALARYALGTAGRMLKRGDISAASAQLLEGLKCIRTPAELFQLVDQALHRYSAG